MSENLNAMLEEAQNLVHEIKIALITDAGEYDPLLEGYPREAVRELVSAATALDYVRWHLEKEASK